MAGEKPSTAPKTQAWFCATGLPSDVVIEVDDMAFNLNKFPLMSKSKKLHDLISEQEAKQNPNHETQNHSDSSDENDDEEGPGKCHVSLPQFPGGFETFGTAAKFCYGVKTELTSSKVAPLRCAAEVLEMTEEYYENNLISKTERFFTQNVLKNIKDSIKALNSCEKIMPLAETLGIVSRCVEAITLKASLYDPSLFGWPVNESSPATGSCPSKNSSKMREREPWIEDLAQLSSAFFSRVISSMRENEVNPEVIETCLIHYAKRCFPGITRSNRKSPSSSSMIKSEAEQRELLESIISDLSSKRSSRSAAATRFLFGLLRTANILSVSEVCKRVLERKIGVQLEQATLDDLLIPSYSYLNETLYDVDCVERILAHFLECYEERDIDSNSVRSPAAIMLVGKLIDGYLSEIASDSNLKPEKFYELAVLLPEQARLYDDGVYRAIDVYLKAHPWISEQEREKISGVMNFEKLTLEACTHAAQNERLPLRAVVQVLFFEQVQLRHAIAGTLLAAEAAAIDSARPSVHGHSDDDEVRDNVGVVTALTYHQDTTTNNNNSKSSTWKAAIRENQVLRLDMDSMRTRVHELERECSTMKKIVEKIDKVGGPQNVDNKGWFTKKFGCKFKAQVCDSHESTVVEANRRGKHHKSKRD